MEWICFPLQKRCIDDHLCRRGEDHKTLCGVLAQPFRCYSLPKLLNIVLPDFLVVGMKDAQSHHTGPSLGTFIFP